MKKFLIFLSILIIGFLLGFSFEFYNLTKMHHKCLNKEYSTVKDSEGKDFNDFLIDCYDNFSLEIKIKYSTEAGFTYMILIGIITIYIYIEYLLLYSTSKNKKIIGFIILGLTIFFIIYFFLLIQNLKIEF